MPPWASVGLSAKWASPCFPSCCEDQLVWKAPHRDHTAFSLVSCTVFFSITLPSPKGPAPSLDLSIQLHPETSASPVRNLHQALGEQQWRAGQEERLDEKSEVRLPHSAPPGPAGHRRPLLSSGCPDTHLLSISAPRGGPCRASTSSWLPSLAAPQWILQSSFQNSSQFLSSRTSCVISSLWSSCTLFLCCGVKIVFLCVALDVLELTL